MNALKIAASDAVRDCFRDTREIVRFDQTDFTDVAVAVLCVDDLAAGVLDAIKRTGFDIPIFLVASQGRSIRSLAIYKQLRDVILQVNGVFDSCRSTCSARNTSRKRASTACPVLRRSCRGCT